MKLVTLVAGRKLEIAVPADGLVIAERQ